MIASETGEFSDVKKAMRNFRRDAYQLTLKFRRDSGHVLNFARDFETRLRFRIARYCVASAIIVSRLQLLLAFVIKTEINSFGFHISRLIF